MVNGEFILNVAEIGDFLYIIVFAILMLVGLWEKVAKAKRPPSPTPPQQQPYDEFEDVDGDQSQPQTLEELVRRMMQTDKTPETKPISADMSVKNYYQPIVCETGENLFSQNEIMSDDENETVNSFDFEFDIRQAVISNEILNRKY